MSKARTRPIQNPRMAECGPRLHVKWERVERERVKWGRAKWERAKWDRAVV